MAVLAFPDEVRRLFWDVDPASVELQLHRDYVMQRIMTRGGWVAMTWLRATYSVAELAEFLGRKGMGLPPRERAYWGLIAGVPLASGPGGSRPSWAGP
jgi:hypothetical protein